MKKKSEELAEELDKISDVEADDKEEILSTQLIKSQTEVKPVQKKSKKQSDAHNTSIVSSVFGIKLISALSYLVFFLPLIFCRHEPYAIFHANQSVALWLFVSLLYIIVACFSLHVMFLLVVIIVHVLGIVFGIYNAANNRARHFWGMAKFNLFKAK